MRESKAPRSLARCAGRFSELDIEHLADESKTWARAKSGSLRAGWPCCWRISSDSDSQSKGRSPSWRATIVLQPKRIALALKATPSLKSVMRELDWQEDMWLDALAQASKEAGLDDLPEACLWSMDEATDPEFWPE